MSERSEIANALVAGLHLLDPTLPIQVDINIAFDQPSDRSWAQLAFLEGGSQFESFGGQGGNLERGPLLAYVNLYTPIGQGDGEAVALSEAAKNALRRLVVTGARFLRFDTGPEGQVAGEWRKQIVAVFSRSVRV